MARRADGAMDPFGLRGIAVCGKGKGKGQSSPTGIAEKYLQKRSICAQEFAPTKCDQHAGCLKISYKNTFLHVQEREVKEARQRSHSCDCTVFRRCSEHENSPKGVHETEEGEGRTRHEEEPVKSPAHGPRPGPARKKQPPLLRASYGPPASPLSSPAPAEEEHLPPPLPVSPVTPELFPVARPGELGPWQLDGAQLRATSPEPSHPPSRDETLSRREAELAARESRLQAREAELAAREAHARPAPFVCSDRPWYPYVHQKQPVLVQRPAPAEQPLLRPRPAEVSGGISLEKLAGLDRPDLKAFQLPEPAMAPPPPPPAAVPAAPPSEAAPTEDGARKGRRRRRPGEERCKMRPGEATVVVSPVPRWYTTGNLHHVLRDWGVAGPIDFLYVPQSGAGRDRHAVANVATPEGLAALSAALSARWLPGSTQPSGVTRAKVQGWENNCKYYNSVPTWPEEARPFIVNLYPPLQ